MKPFSKIMLPVCFVASCFCNSGMASYIDFTVEGLTGSSNIFMGSVDGLGYTLIATDDIIFNGDRGYDGSSNTGCQIGGGQLACNKTGTGRRSGDGAGIDGDEITEGQIMGLMFDSAVRITSLEFLDLYIGTGTEQATVTIGSSTFTKDAIGSSGDGGYAKLDLGGLVLGLGEMILLSAVADSDFRDDGTNDYALAGIEVSAVPIPAAAWLFGSALIGLIGFSKRKSRVAS